jgi:hypothetical protein
LGTWRRDGVIGPTRASADTAAGGCDGDFNVWEVLLDVAVLSDPDTEEDTLRRDISEVERSMTGVLTLSWWSS